MILLISVLIGLLIVAAIVGPIIYIHSRTILREQKDFERGLKMVTLRIHLPPSSDDTEVGSRDSRDVIDENISKAEIVYNILSSTLQKGFKSNFYGQRHISFEIIGHKGFVNFYVAVPVSLIDVMHQAIVSAYPSAQLEEVADHNIFSPVGKISATIGGELTLKEKYYYPIATYKDIKRDPISSVLNAMSSLDKEDGVGVQIMIRPAQDGWRKKAGDYVKKKRKGHSSHSGLKAGLVWFAQTMEALWKPPEDKGNDHSLSSHEEGIVSSIEDKTKHPGFETSIRVIASSNVAQKSQSVLNNIVSSFALFDSPGRNGFKYVAAHDIERFATAYIMRFFPGEHSKNILNSVELATMFHFPQQEDIPTSQVTRQESKQVDGPRNMPDKGLLLGYNVFRGVKKPIRLDTGDRQRHMYVVGQTGVGKSVFLENMALQDMIDGNGFAFIDPHGDTAEKLLSMVPKERTEDIIYFSPADTDYPLGLNIFEADTDDQKDFLIQEVINMLYKLYDPQRTGIIGPRYEHIFRMSALTVMAGPDGGTFIDIPKLFVDQAYVDKKLEYITDQNVIDFWRKEMVQAKRSNEFGDVVSWFVSKFGAFLSNSMMRNIIGQTKSSFNLREIMDNRKILIINLSKGKTGDLNSKLLGMIFVMQFQAAAMSRANIPEDQRVNFYLYVDEFQNFSTESFATIMSEARKYRLSLTVANQFTTQLTEEIRDAVFGNMGTIVSFRIGQNDVESLSRYFRPLFDGDDLLRVPNYNTIVRTMVGGVPTQPFSMSTIPPLGNPSEELGGTLKQLSAMKFGRPRAIVEKEIFARVKANSDDSVTQKDTAATPKTAPSQPAAQTQGSFLDQWLAKKQKSSTTSPSLAPIAPTGPLKPVDKAEAQDGSIAESAADKPLLDNQSQKGFAPVADVNSSIQDVLMNQSQSASKNTSPKSISDQPGSDNLIKISKNEQARNHYQDVTSSVSLSPVAPRQRQRGSDIFIGRDGRPKK